MNGYKINGVYFIRHHYKHFATIQGQGGIFYIFENDNSHRINNDSTGIIENPIGYPIRILIPIGDCISYNMSVKIYVVYFLNTLFLFANKIQIEDTFQALNQQHS